MGFHRYILAFQTELVYFTTVIYLTSYEQDEALVTCKTNNDYYYSSTSFYSSTSLFNFETGFLVHEIFKPFPTSFNVTAEQNEGNTALGNGHGLTKGAEHLHPDTVCSPPAALQQANMVSDFCL